MPAPFDTALRKYATQATVALSIVVGVTGVMMFFHLGKAQVEGMHEWLGMAFAAVAALHVVRHRTIFVSMLSQTRMRVLFAATALAVVAFLTLTPAKQGNPMRELPRLFLTAPIEDVAPLLDVLPQELAARVGVTDTTLSMDAVAKAQGRDPMQVLGAAVARH